MLEALTGQNLIRIAALAVGLSTLSFAAGVAGDLSIIDPPRSGQRVVLRIPPELPADTVRAAPLPPLISTVSAEATVRRERVRQVALRLAARDVQTAAAPKPAPRLEVQLARVTPKAIPAQRYAKDERQSA